MDRPGVCPHAPENKMTINYVKTTAYTTIAMGDTAYRTIRNCPAAKGITTNARTRNGVRQTRCEFAERKLPAKICNVKRFNNGLGAKL
jgi:hypothetical protein